jgi:uncharacterized 2Fe-2S/4Fe-4S cluster protein (DUF4445 family)
VDALSGLLDAGLITTDGRLLSRKGAGDSPYAGRLTENSHSQFLLTEEDPAPGGRPVVVTQKDIREVQLAKGAMLAGIWILLDHLGLKTEDVQEVYLAGAFGNYVRARSALRIGLLPAFPKAVIRQVGNAAGSGAKMALISQRAFEEARRIAERIEYVDLARATDFQQQFVKGMAFPS